VAGNLKGKLPQRRGAHSFGPAPQGGALSGTLGFLHIEGMLTAPKLRTPVQTNAGSNLVTPHSLQEMFNSVFIQ